jgi:hypothetical protein
MEGVKKSLPILLDVFYPVCRVWLGGLWYAGLSVMVTLLQQ